jgi:16S rRNA processing protein RimM
LAGDILLAVVIGVQGLQGAVKTKIFTAVPDALTRYGALHDSNGKRFEITAFRTGKPGEAVMSFQGVTTREAAEMLKGTQLFIARDALPPPDEEEFYHADLIGLDAQDSEGRIIGKVAAVHNFGAGDVIEITRRSADGTEGGDSVLLSFTHETVPVIDVPGGHIVVAVPETDDEGNNYVE